MNGCTTHSRPDTSALLDAARRRSHELRQQALDDFWHGLASGATQAARSAERLARSLVRHARLRNG